MAPAVRPIIKKKKAAGHAAHHGGAWKVAYADFVTAMMAFFLVMWIMGLSESSRKAIAGYFREPGIFSFTTGKALPVKMTVAESQHAGDGSGATGKEAPEQVLKKGCEESDGPSVIESTKIEKLQADLQHQLNELAQKRPDLQKLLKSVSMEVTKEGLRIELSETKDVAFFEVGGAVPNKAARDVLAILAPRLAELGNDIVAEGHTDTRPFRAGATYTNWELSADRANAARKLLLDGGLDPKQIVSVTGYADARLRKKEDPYDLSNRRVSIVVKFREGTPPPPVKPPLPEAPPPAGPPK
jgi:chemotaxis protein MotB